MAKREKEMVMTSEDKHLKLLTDSARRIYRLTEVSLFKAEREGRHAAVDQLRIKLRERFERYNELRRKAVRP
jgi:hypothetical protein